MARTLARPLLDAPLLRRALADALRKLDPRVQVRNPVMFVVLAGSVLTTALFVQSLAGGGGGGLLLETVPDLRAAAEVR